MKSRTVVCGGSIVLNHGIVEFISRSQTHAGARKERRLETMVLTYGSKEHFSRKWAYLFASHKVLLHLLVLYPSTPNALCPSLVLILILNVVSSIMSSVRWFWAMPSARFGHLLPVHLRFCILKTYRVPANLWGFMRCKRYFSKELVISMHFLEILSLR